MQLLGGVDGCGRRALQEKDQASDVYSKCLCSPQSTNLSCVLISLNFLPWVLGSVGESGCGV
jgi:hypothetical protein